MNLFRPVSRNEFECNQNKIANYDSFLGDAKNIKRFCCGTKNQTNREKVKVTFVAAGFERKPVKIVTVDRCDNNH